MAQVVINIRDGRGRKIGESYSSGSSIFQILDFPDKSVEDLKSEIYGLNPPVIKIDGELCYQSPEDSKWYIIESYDFGTYWDSGSESFIPSYLTVDDAPTVIREATQAEIDAELES